MRIIRKTAIVLICIVSVLLSACTGQSKRSDSIPSEAEALSEVSGEMGIKGAKVLDIQDVRNEKDYYGIDAVYTISCDRLDEFTLLRSWVYDSLFDAGYYYGWTTDYSDLVMEDYLKDHPLPDGIFYSEGPYAQAGYGAQRFFGEKSRQIWFDFNSDEEFEDYLAALEPWLDDWLLYERQFLAPGKDPRIQVAAVRPKDDTMNFSIQLYRTFGYEEDSFHMIGEDGETYTWSSFRKAMENGYKAKKDLMMK